MTEKIQYSILKDKNVYLNCDFDENWNKSMINL